VRGERYKIQADELEGIKTNTSLLVAKGFGENDKRVGTLFDCVPPLLKPHPATKKAAPFMAFYKLYYCYSFLYSTII
jgi:hypothetical protein